MSTRLFKTIDDLRKKTPSVDDNVWHLVSSKWWQLFEESENELDPIDNTDILVHEDGSDEVKEDSEFVLVPQEGWDLLFQRFGGGPDISRPVVAVGDRVMVEVFPYNLVCLFGKDHKTLQVSRATSVEKLLEMALEAFKIKENKQYYLLYNYYAEEKGDVLDLKATVFTSKLFDKQHILLEDSRKKDTSSKSSIVNPHLTVQCGLTGLKNLGNTCFVNSAVQCISHIRELTTYFLSSQFMGDINLINPLGTKGDLVNEYYKLVKELWAGTAKSIIPKDFLYAMSKHSSMFEGYGQHDSQEFLAFFLDGLHEDLNRVKHKVPTNTVSADNEENLVAVAQMAWKMHLRRNDSFIMDLFQAQLKSKLQCLDCGKISITFDPFMYLSVPTPPVKRNIEVTVISEHEFIKYTVSIEPNAPIRLLLEGLATISHHNVEELVLCEIYKHKIYKIFALEHSTSSIANSDTLIAYVLSKKEGYINVPVFQRWLRPRYNPKTQTSEFSYNLTFLPFFVSLPTSIYYNELSQILLQKVKPLVVSSNNRYPFTVSVVDKAGSTLNNLLPFHPQITLDSKSWLSIDWDISVYNEKNSTVNLASPTLDSSCKQRQVGKGVHLHDCLRLFTEKEVLTKENTWYCPDCKEHKQASKQMSIWNTPDILIIHLKRFSSNPFKKGKVDMLIDFPLLEFDISEFTETKDTNSIYDLFGVINHYGVMGGGHYTSYIKYFNTKSWHKFDDDRVSELKTENVVSPAAYVLFYKRRT